MKIADLKKLRAALAEKRERNIPDLEETIDAETIPEEFVFPTEARRVLRKGAR